MQFDPNFANFFDEEQLEGQSFLILYPSADEYEPIMKRVDGRNKGETFWCHVTGRALVISHRTVEIYRARLMRKYKASTTADLVHKLMAG